MEIEFTFKVTEMLNLMASNTDSGNVVIRVKTGGKKPFTARMQTNYFAADAMTNDIPVDDGSVIEGCPYPPGCTD